MFVLDRMAIFFKMFIVGASILVILASIEYVNRFAFFRGEYYFLIVMSALGMMFMASANDLLSLFVTLEFSTFGFYVLVAYLREDLASNEAGLKFFILGVFAAGLLAYGISLVYGETGKLVFSDMASATATPGLIIGFLLIFAALGFKIGAVPFLSRCTHARNGISLHRAERRSHRHPPPVVFRSPVHLQADVGALARGRLGLVDDLRQHRGHRSNQYQAPPGLFRHCPNRERVNRLGSRNEDGQRCDPVLSPHLSLREYRCLRRRDRHEPCHWQ
jgi:hypothetical protein